MIGHDHVLSAPALIDDSLGELLDGNLAYVSFFTYSRDVLAALLAAQPHATVRLSDLICKSVHEAWWTARKKCITNRIGVDLLERGLPCRLLAMLLNGR